MTCPLSMASATIRNCKNIDCAWYVEQEKKCVIKIIADKLDGKIVTNSVRQGDKE